MILQYLLYKRDSSLSIFEEENLRFRRVNGLNEDIYDLLFRCNEATLLFVRTFLILMKLDTYWLFWTRIDDFTTMKITFSEKHIRIQSRFDAKRNA